MPVTNPTADAVHVNTPLTNFAQRWTQNESKFIAGEAMPGIGVAKQSDLYYIMSRADMLSDEAQERADMTESAGGGFRQTTDQYYCRVYAFHKDISDRQRQNADSQIQLDRSASIFVQNKMLIRRERLFMETFFTEGSSTTWGVEKAGGNWSSTTDPIPELRDEMRTMESSTGYRPNRMLMTRKAWDLFMDNDQVLDRVVGGSTSDNPARVVLQRLVAQLLEIDSVHVTSAVYNAGLQAADVSSDVNAGEDTDFIVPGAKVLLYYAPQAVLSSDQEPTAGLRFNWTGLLGAQAGRSVISKFSLRPKIKADRIEGEMAMEMKKTAPELGVLLHTLDS